jgi:LPXTG-site transpeptidase (sortase) family protein
MKKRINQHSWLLSIVVGVLMLVFTLPGYFTSAISSPQAATQPPIQPRELTNTNVVHMPEKITRAESLSMTLDRTSGQPAGAVQSLPAYLDATAAFIRSGDEALNHPPVPDRIVIQSIALSAPVIPAGHSFTEVEGSTFGQWLAPGYFAAGWHPDSALPGEAGNTVINGHHNIAGEVFADLVDVKEGDTIIVYADERAFAYVVTNRMILPETFMDAATRLENARWLAQSEDVRLTLVTCWPKESYTHRLILVAVPIN